MKLPPAYAWLAKEPAPRILVAALKLYGTTETKGKADNPVIMEWARGLGRTIAAAYTADAVPWCALFLSHVCRTLALPVPEGYQALRAFGFLTWGNATPYAMLGDILVFKRDGGGHVGIYVGEDPDCYHVLGGNQGDRVSIVRISKSRCVAVRRTPWERRQPDTVRRIVLEPTGAVSSNEA